MKHHALFFLLLFLIPSLGFSQQCDDGFLLKLSQRTRCLFGTDASGCAVAGAATAALGVANMSAIEAGSAQQKIDKLTDSIDLNETKKGSLEHRINANQASLDAVRSQKDSAAHNNSTESRSLPGSTTHASRLARKEKVLTEDLQQQKIHKRGIEAELWKEAGELQKAQGKAKAMARLRNVSAGIGAILGFGLLVLAAEEWRDWTFNDTEECIRHSGYSVEKMSDLKKYASYKKVDGACKLVIPHFKLVELMTASKANREHFFKNSPEYCAKLQEAYQKMKPPPEVDIKNPNEQITCTDKGELRSIKFDDGELITVTKFGEGKNHCLRFEGIFPSEGVMKNRPGRDYNFPLCDAAQGEYSSFGDFRNVMASGDPLHSDLPASQIAAFYKEPKCNIASLADLDGARNCAAFNYLRIKQFASGQLMNFCRSKTISKTNSTGATP